MCQDCSNAAQSPRYRTYNPACLPCGARFVKQLKELDLTEKQLADWRSKVMDDWEAYGHDRAALRELARAKGLPYAEGGKQ